MRRSCSISSRREKSSDPAHGPITFSRSSCQYSFTLKISRDGSKKSLSNWSPYANAIAGKLGYATHGLVHWRGQCGRTPGQNTVRRKYYPRPTPHLRQTNIQPYSTVIAGSREIGGAKIAVVPADFPVSHRSRVAVKLGAGYADNAIDLPQMDGAFIKKRAFTGQKANMPSRGSCLR